MKKYYYDEHETTYQAMKTRNIKAWDEYHDPDGYSYENFMMRPFLEKALGMININSKIKKAFEYGCGTGAGANFLVQKGFLVDAIDISPTAISIAKEIALEQNININYCVEDLLTVPSLNHEYDLILDNYCLQSIVMNIDREKLFSIVRSGLKESGYYIIATAIFNESRSYLGDDCYYDEDSGIVYDRVSSDSQFEHVINYNGSYWIPNRRHLKKEKLREELLYAGFNVLYQEDGNLICKK